MEIRVTYTSVDGIRRLRKFNTLKGASKFAQNRIGEFPEMGIGYAIAGDGIGKITVVGATLADLFPGAA